MACSEAQLLANRANALKSTGPTTAAGKARSRANSLKHGLTGAAIVIPGEDAAEVDRRIDEVVAELQPQGGLTQGLARRAAGLLVRLDRAMAQEAAMLAAKVRHAAEAFDDARADEADHLIGWIASEPPTFRRKLERTPEGCDRLAWAFEGLRADLLHGGWVGDGDARSTRWTMTHGQKFDEYTGRRDTDYPASRCYALSRALGGDPSLLAAGEGEGLDPQALQAWARDRLAAEIEAQVDLVRRHRATIDHEAIAEDRREAGARATFDSTPDAVLARKYEAATERQLVRTVRLIQELKQPAPEPARATQTRPQPVAPHDLAIHAAVGGGSPLGSFFPGSIAAAAAAGRPLPAASTPPIGPDPAPTRAEFARISAGASTIPPART